MLMCVPQRHLRPESASLISASVGFFLSRRKRGSRHQPAVDAVAALRHLLLDIGGLQWMWLFRCPKACERRDLGVADGRYRGDARTGRLAVKMHRAGAALRKPATEMWIVETKIVTQCIEQRHVRIGVDSVRRAVDRKGKALGHSVQLPEQFAGQGLTAAHPIADASCGDACGPQASPAHWSWERPIAIK